MLENQSSLFYNETLVISDLLSVNIRKNDQEEYFSEQFRICSGCNRIVRFVKDSSDSLDFKADHDFLFEEFEYIGKPNLQSEDVMRRDASIQMLTSLFSNDVEIDSLEDFRNHVAMCHSNNENPFQVSDGIWPIDDSSPDYEKRMINLMYFLSKKENKYHYSPGGLWEEEYYFHWKPTHLLVEAGIPLGYCAVYPLFAYSKENNWYFSEDEELLENNCINIPRKLLTVSVDGYHQHGEMFLIHDLYVLPEFRRKGYGKKILQSLSRHEGFEIDINTDFLLVTEPVSPISKKLFFSFSTDKIVRVFFDPFIRGQSVSKEDFVKN